MGASRGRGGGPGLKKAGLRYEEEEGRAYLGVRRRRSALGDLLQSLGGGVCRDSPLLGGRSGAGREASPWSFPVML